MCEFVWSEMDDLRGLAQLILRHAGSASFSQLTCLQRPSCRSVNRMNSSKIVPRQQLGHQDHVPTDSKQQCDDVPPMLLDAMIICSFHRCATKVLRVLNLSRPNVTSSHPHNLRSSVGELHETADATSIVHHIELTAHSVRCAAVHRSRGVCYSVQPVTIDTRAHRKGSARDQQSLLISRTAVTALFGACSVAPPPLLTGRPRLRLKDDWRL